MGCLTYIGYDIMFLEVCNFIILKLDILMEYAKHIGSRATDKMSQRELLLLVISKHTDVLDVLDMVNSFFSVNIFVTYLCQTAILCTLLVAILLVCIFLKSH